MIIIILVGTQNKKNYTNLRTQSHMRNDSIIK